MPAKRGRHSKPRIGRKAASSSTVVAATDSSKSAPAAKKKKPVTPPTRRSSRITAQASRLNFTTPGSNSGEASVAVVDVNPPSTVHLNELPLDVLVHIISYTSYKDMFNMERVSRWMRAVTRAAWKDVDAISTRTKYYSSRSEFVSKRRCPKGINDRIAKAIIKRGDIRYLSAGAPIGICKITSDIFSVASLMPNLRRLHLENISLTNRNITTLASYCEDLTHVTFKNCFAGAIPDRSLGTLFTKCTKLVHVDLARNYSLKGDSLLSLSPNVESLNLMKNRQISASTMIDIVKSLPNIQILFFECGAFSSDTVNDILRCLPRLRGLEIDNLLQHDEFATPLDFSHNPDLEVLCALDNCCIWEQTLTTLANCCKKLRSLAFEHYEFGPSDAVRILADCKSLRVLYLFDTYDIHDLAYVVNSCGIQYLRLTAYTHYTKEQLAEFINSTSTTLKNVSSVIEMPYRFHSSEFMDQYFTDQMESLTNVDGIDPDRPLFHAKDVYNDFDYDRIVRQSGLQKIRYHSADFYNNYDLVLEFGSPVY